MENNKLCSSKRDTVNETTLLFSLCVEENKYNVVKN